MTSQPSSHELSQMQLPSLLPSTLHAQHHRGLHHLPSLHPLLLQSHLLLSHQLEQLSSQLQLLEHPLSHHALVPLHQMHVLLLQDYRLLPPQQLQLPPQQSELHHHHLHLRQQQLEQRHEPHHEHELGSIPMIASIRVGLALLQRLLHRQLLRLLLLHLSGCLQHSRSLTQLPLLPLAQLPQDSLLRRSQLVQLPLQHHEHEHVYDPTRTTARNRRRC